MFASSWWIKYRGSLVEQSFDIDILADPAIKVTVSEDEHGITISIRGLSAPEQLLPIADRIYSINAIPVPERAL